MKIDFGGETIQLLPQRAFHWARQDLIGFSDVHLGKAQSLQRSGIPIPKEAHNDDLDQIAFLIETFRPHDVVILGDFIHQKDSWSDDLLSELKVFFGRYPQVRINLILGNHDKGSEEYLFRLPFHLHEAEMTRGSLTLAHGHRDTEHEFRIEGHIHPVCVLREGATKLRLPCFVASEDRLLLPSFGALTGGYEVERKSKQKLYAVTPTQVFEIKERG